MSVATNGAANTTPSPSDAASDSKRSQHSSGSCSTKNTTRRRSATFGSTGTKSGFSSDSGMLDQHDTEATGEPGSHDGSSESNAPSVSPSTNAATMPG